METIENNKLIAEFMGFPTQTDAVDDRVLAYYIGDVIKNADNSKNENENNVFHPEDMQFNTSWDWLMPIVEKIEEIKGVPEHESWIGLVSSIEPTYKNVVEFIKQKNN